MSVLAFRTKAPQELALQPQPRQHVTLVAYNPLTDDFISVAIDLSGAKKADKAFRRFARKITHHGYILEGAR